MVSVFSKCFFFFWFLTDFVIAEAVLRVGMELSYPPFETICPDGTPCGISVEIAEALGRYLHRQVRIENISFVGLIPALKKDKIDIIVSSLSVTDERSRSIDFSDPYLEVGLSLLVNRNSTVADIADLDQTDRVVVVKSGTSGEQYARNHLHRAKVRVLDKEAMGVLEVIQGKADAFIYDQFSVYMNAKKNPATTKALLKPFQKESWAIGVKKGNDALLKQINDFIVSFRAEGGFERLRKKYFGSEGTDETEAPFVF